MKINNNCARRVLLEVEKIKYGETISVSKLQENISEYSIEDILSIVTLFNRENYLRVIDKAVYDDSDVLRDHKIKCLTEKGYKTLDLIRNDKIWDLIKNNIENFENISIFTIFDIANKLVNHDYNKTFNLPDNLSLSNSRW